MRPAPRSSSGSRTSGGWRRAPRQLLGLAAAIAAGCGSPPPTPVDSVVVLDLDTLRADGLGCYGNPRGTSPAIDALAASGVRFEWAFAQAPNTPPSQASILTGLYPARHGRRGDFDAVRGEVETLAEALGRSGVRTAAFVDGGFMAAGFGLEQGFEVYDDARGAGLAEVAARALRWLDTLGDERFFVLLHAYDVHAPYAPPEPHRSRFAALVDPPSPGFEPTVEILEAARKAGHAGSRPVLAPADARHARALYDGEVRAVDDVVAAFLRELSERGLDRRAAVVLISDHGEEFLEHGSVLHEKLYSSVLRVPWIVRLPGVPGGRVVDAAVQTVDLAPSVLELMGVPAGPPVDGRSLAAELRGERGAPSIAFAESPFFGEERSLVAGPFRLLWRKGSGARELYRYRDDPAEQRDLAGAEAAAVERLSAALDRLDQELEADRSGGRAPAVDLSAETLRQLRSLGYLQ